MKKAQKNNSTILSLRDTQTRRAKNALFFSGLFALALVIYGFCFLTDSKYLGSAGLFSFWKEADRSLSFELRELGMLPRVYYSLSAEGLRPEKTDISSFFYFLLLAIFVLSCLHGIIAGIFRAATRAAIERQLAPLYKMAETAVRLSDESRSHTSAQPKSETRLHDLESAIENMNPATPYSELHTGYTELIGLEDAINSLLDRTRESYSQQIRFVSDASHELRTPIAVIKGYTDMLDRWGKSDEKILEESINAIKTETEHMNTLVEQLLFLARGDSGRTKLKLEEFSLSDMMREVYGESVMIDDGHRWELAADGEVVAEGDTALLKQAVRILVDNAAKYTPSGETIVLRAKYDREGKPSVEVQDDGAGIPQKDLAHIFDRFFRSDPSRSGSQSGTGLGLAIAKWIVDRHGGYFDVVSRESVGTRISIHLPSPAKKPQKAGK